MTDTANLCERLRDRAAFCKDCGGVTTYDEGDSALDNEAADLIERLDAMLAASPQGKGSSADAEPTCGDLWWNPANYEDGFLHWADAFENANENGEDYSVELHRARKLPPVWGALVSVDGKQRVKIFATEAEADEARATPPAMSADHIGEAQGWRDIATAPRQEPVLVGHSGFLGWRRLAICNALGEWSYCDRPWLQQDPLDETPTHWHPLPPPPSAHPAPIKPSGDTGELRERVARIVDPAGFDDRWDVPGLRHEASLDERVDEALAKADAILDLIQSERAG